MCFFGRSLAEVRLISALDSQLFDVKFYPYPTPDGDQIFAVAGGKDVSYSSVRSRCLAYESKVFICRPKLDEDPPFELLGWFKEEEVSASRRIHSFSADT